MWCWYWNIFPRMGLGGWMTATESKDRLPATLYIMHRRVLALRVARGIHSSWLSIPVTLLVLCQRLQTYWAARRCTISSGGCTCWECCALYVQLAWCSIYQYLFTFHLPGEFPLGYRIKVSLQKGGIVLGFDAAVEDAIISKETDCTIDGFVGEVVDLYKK